MDAIKQLTIPYVCMCADGKMQTHVRHICVIFILLPLHISFSLFSVRVKQNWNVNLQLDLRIVLLVAYVQKHIFDCKLVQ